MHICSLCSLDMSGAVQQHLAVGLNPLGFGTVQPAFPPRVTAATTSCNLQIACRASCPRLDRGQVLLPSCKGNAAVLPQRLQLLLRLCSGLYQLKSSDYSCMPTKRVPSWLLLLLQPLLCLHNLPQH